MFRFSQLASRLAISICGASATVACADANRAGAHDFREGGVIEDPRIDADTDDDPVRPISGLRTGEWTRLINQKWTLDPGTEGYWCKRVSVASDVFINGFRSVAPTGTHHSTLGKDPGPDGTFRCSGFSTGTDLIYGSSTTGGRTLPRNASPASTASVATKLRPVRTIRSARSSGNAGRAARPPTAIVFSPATKPPEHRFPSRTDHS